MMLMEMGAKVFLLSNTQNCKNRAMQEEPTRLKHTVRVCVCVCEL